MAETLTEAPPPTAAPPTSPPASPVVAAPNGAATPPPSPGPSDWRASIPPEYKDAKHWDALKDKALPDVLKSYSEQQKFLGTSVRIPTAESKPEDQAAFWAKLGAHDAPEKYVVPERAADAPPIDTGILSYFQRLAHQIHMPHDMWTAFVQGYEQSPLANPEQMIEQTKTASLNALQTKYGAATDHTLNLAAAGLKHIEHRLGTNGRIHEKLQRVGLAVDVDFVELFNRFGKDYSEHGDAPRGAMQAFQLSAAEAETKIAELTRDPKGPYWTDGPGHAEAVQEVYRLREVVAAARQAKT